MSRFMFCAEGDNSVIYDENDATLISVPWDGKQTGEGGVNDRLCRIVDTMNAFTDLIGFAKRQNESLNKEPSPRPPTGNDWNELYEEIISAENYVVSGVFI